MEQNVNIVALKKETIVKFRSLPDGAWFVIPDDDGEGGNGLCVKANNDHNAINAYAIAETFHTFICDANADVKRVFPTITYYEE